MVRAEPETAVKTNPPAVVKAIVDTGSGKKIGAGAAEEKESRQAAVAKTIKPWKIKFQFLKISLKFCIVLTINFMIKLLVMVLSVWYWPV